MQEMDVEYGEGCSTIRPTPVDILTKSTCADGSDQTNAKKKVRLTVPFVSDNEMRLSATLY